MMRALKSKIYEGWLSSPGMLEKTRLRGALITVYIFQKVGSRNGGADIFSLVRSRT